MPGEAGRPWGPFLLWVGVGALFGLGVVGILSIGVFALGGAALLAAFGMAVPGSRSTAMAGIVPGLGIVPLLVGLSNLGGPGELCSADACTELLSPWPFLLPGLTLVVGGGWLVWRLSLARPSRRPQEGTRGHDESRRG